MYHFKSANNASWNSSCDSFLREGKGNEGGKAEDTKGGDGKKREKIEIGPKGERPRGLRQARRDDKRVQERQDERTERRDRQRQRAEEAIQGEIKGLWRRKETKKGER